MKKLDRKALKELIKEVLSNVGLPASTNKTKYLMRFSSESGDHYKVTVISDHLPTTDADLHKIFKKHMTGEYDGAKDAGWNGPGLLGTYLYLDSVKNLTTGEMIKI